MLEFTQAIRVQVIDADPVARLRLSAYLRATGLEVQAATNAVRALAQMREVVPHVLVLDPAVPRSQALLAHCPDVPLLLLSAEPNLGQVAQSLGAWAALAKPTDLDVVLAVVKRIAGRRAPRIVSACKGYPPARRTVVKPGPARGPVRAGSQPAARSRRRRTHHR